ncbi:glycosyltransferase [Arthrobacter sp. NQ7]|uniref:glycosyltransferase n=1 Tax=Arthrobacter sp. NQ7 TaxID=3032303 RepID=UPI00240F4C15|nr:glycosyltransferase [Arthrobacter sp. NQ7]MDJ0457059.1 glycosyltransferase [Arthrobacter sp. NQ7]
MSRILAYTSPAIGHLFPMTPLLLELARRGHQVEVRTLPDQVDLMRGLGLAAEPIDERVAGIEHRDFGTKNTLEALSASVDVFVRRAAIDGGDLAAAIASTSPDAVIVDFNSWGARAAAQAWGGPWAAFCPFTPPVTSRGAPPFGPGLPPLGGPIGRLRDSLLRPLIMGQLEKRFVPGINRILTTNGVPAVTSADGFFRSAPLTLVTTSEPFEYPHPDWAPDIRLIGALPWEPPAQVPAWVQEPGDPFVLVTTSSEYQSDEALARAAAQGLGGEPYRVVVTMPAGIADLGPLSPNVRVEQFVPHGPVLARSAVAVTHGGMGATQKALNSGVPCVVVPFGRDQLEVAARVKHANAGVRLPKGKLTPERLRNAVRCAATMADGASRIASGYRAAGGAMAGATAVEELITQKPRTPRPEAARKGPDQP